MIFIRAMVLVALIQILIQTDKPFLCSGIYAAGATVGGLSTGHGIIAMAVAGVIAFALSSLFFWFPDRFDGSFLQWIIMILGSCHCTGLISCSSA